MASECRLLLYASNSMIATEVAEQVMQEVYRIEARYSRYLSHSVLSDINQHAALGTSLSVDVETAALLDFAFAAFHISGGLFDITSGVLRHVWDFNGSTLPSANDINQLLPIIGMDKLVWSNPTLSFSSSGMNLDFGGIGKEYAVDRAADICLSAGIYHGLIDFGGDVRVLGGHPDGSAWRIAIRHPRHSESALLHVNLAQGALATSGDYERYIDVDDQRYCHILNPKTGWSASGLRSVSVATDRCLLAGALSTTAMLKGASAMAWLDGLGVAYIAVDDTGQVHQHLT